MQLELNQFNWVNWVKNPHRKEIKDENKFLIRINEFEEFFFRENKNEYLSIALKYMSETNIKKLIDLRKKLRPQLLKSSLFDANSFAESFIIELNKVYEKNKINS